MELIASRQAAWQGLPGGEEAAAPPSMEAASSPTAEGDAEEDEVAAVSRAAERALQELDAAIAQSMDLAESSDDPGSAQVC